MLLGGSLSFYFWGEPFFCALALASATLDYLLGKVIYHYCRTSKQGRQLVALGITANLLILFYFKYTHFFLSSLIKLFPNSSFQLETFKILLPIGVSFIVFEKITYLVDIYRGSGKPAQNLIKYLNYVFLFPKLLAGPIIKYHEIENSLICAHSLPISSPGVLDAF